MSCNDVASVLANHRSTRLAPAERAKIDAHVAACADCAAAWHAEDELLALRVPPVPSALLERALLASRLPQSASARRARSVVVAGAVILAGAAAAAAVTMSVLREQSAPIASSPMVKETAAPVASDTAPAVTQDARAAPVGDGVTAVELVETGHDDVIPLVRANPLYPTQALAKRLEGSVQLKFDVSSAGTVENVSVVDSSDPVFEESAATAIAQWRYLPRILAGKRVRHEGVHTMIRGIL